MKTVISLPPIYFFGIISLNFLIYFIYKEFDAIPVPHNYMGVIVMAVGFYILKKSSNSFNRRKTTFRLEKPTAFVRSGFYRYSRNPMYLGALVMILGQAVILGNLLTLISPALFFLSMNYFCIPPEEKLLEKTFGSQYLKYKRKVRRWL